ncbi:hypothetical protein GUITHDRAFT_144009 [Guillardia theta CCMP2712]|uniref:Lysine--tRNA ligase n=1 Tax=Guillardia theta (strain CCMP2712) TaxID=905079 RepID=L1ISH0_GUITC|nr:hypothetical protein GUITHDRAFT_144009 [Guillardia theta CCMP2712]EKX38829.1 hypothetical protein GUITHDRAFT_144009 [Guillardia theta CCMP2712]|eukprot:XP_005825809.1 hypothetical protein GUITHDRAFT_144009 [Guillardia theta CCMP2712]
MEENKTGKEEDEEDMEENKTGKEEDEEDMEENKTGKEEDEEDMEENKTGKEDDEERRRGSERWTKEAQGKGSESIPDAREDEGYMRMRWQDLEQFQQARGSVYPHKFDVTIEIQEFLNKYACLEAGEQRKDERQSVAGRIIGLRRAGKNLIFIDVKSNGSRMQLMVDRQHFDGEDWEELMGKILKRGDVVGATGIPARNKRGEICLIPLSVKLLAPCVRILPKDYYGLKDPDLRFRNRYVDLICNSQVRQHFEGRAKIIRAIRNYLDNIGFLEVETPMLSRQASGAAARPFKTFHNDLESELFMRVMQREQRRGRADADRQVAPELYLKQLVVGGLDKVYELGKCFRNEGVDATHNPEFTSIEIYQAYADYMDMLEMLERMLKSVCQEVSSRDKSGTIELDFSRPFQRLDYMQAIEEAAGQKLPHPSELETTESVKLLREILSKFKVSAPSNAHASILLDKLCGELVEPKLIQPTFLINQPLCMSPLAKEHREMAGVSERFELFILGREVANAYTELNDPREQKTRFEEQMLKKQQGDEEAIVLDDSFLHALDYGLPPTGGCGIGIDRICMTLLDLPSIREVQLFPLLRPKEGKPEEP